MVSQELEVMAKLQGREIDEVIEELTEFSTEEVREKIEEHFDGLLPDGKSREDFDGRYERGEVSDLTKGTYKQREIAAENFLQWFTENDREYITEDTIEDFLKYYKNQKEYSAGTIESRYWQLISLFREEFSATVEQQAKDADHLQYIKAARQESDPEEGSGARPLKRPEYDKMLETVDNRRLELILRIAWQTGMRASEIANLRVDDVNLDEKKFNVRTAKRSGHTRTLSMNLKLKRELEKWINAYREDYTQAGNSGYLLPTHKSEKIYPRNLTKAVKDLASDAGVQTKNEGIHSNGAKRAELTVHSFRKSFGIRRLSDGDSVRKVQLLLGHSDIGTTQNYLELDDDDLDYTPRS